MKTKLMPAILLVLFCPSCAKKHEAPSYKVEMDDGVKVIRNFQADSGRGFRPVEFSMDLSIGVEEGDEKYMFVSPVDANSDRNGNVYVLDSYDCVVKEYDLHGAFLREFGRKGQGPGEFQSPSCMRISDQNEIYVRDDNKIEVFSATGEYNKTLPVDGYSYFDIIDSGALIIDQRISDKDGAEYSSVARFELQSRNAHAFLSQRCYWPSRIMDNEFIYEYPYFVRWGVNSKRQIYAASGVDYRISIFDSLGNLLFRFIRDTAQVPVVGDELKKIEASATRGPNPYRAKPVYPAFRYISIDETDRVWVERYQPGWRKRANKATVYDVFSAKGIFLFSTRIPGHVYPQLKFKNGFIYALKKHDSGYLSAVRIKMKE